MATIKVAGMDPSFKNWGLTFALYDTHTGLLDIQNLDVIQPHCDNNKQTRRNTKDLQIAQQLADRVLAPHEYRQAIFVEVPVGSQSARAMMSYGVCVGILGALRATNIPFFEVTPNEVKLAAVNNKKASKHEMIQWATTLYPTANWPTRQVKGETQIIEGKAEHMADSIGAIHAGILQPEFQRLIQFIQD